MGRDDEEAAEAQDVPREEFLFHAERLAGVGRTPQMRQFALREQVADLAVERLGQSQGDAYVGLVRLASTFDAADGGHRNVRQHRQVADGQAVLFALGTQVMRHTNHLFHVGGATHLRDKFDIYNSINM